MQDYAEDIFEKLTDAHPVVAQAMEILLDSQQLETLQESERMPIYAGFAASFELTRIVADTPIALMHTVISCFHALNRLFKEKPNLFKNEEGDAPTDLSELPLFFLDMAMFNLSAYGLQVKNLDHILPLYLRLGEQGDKTVSLEREQAVDHVLKALGIAHRHLRYAPYMRHYAAHIRAKDFRGYWVVAMALEGLLRAHQLAYTDPLCHLDDTLENWLTTWSCHIPSTHVLVAVDEMKATGLEGMYFFVVSPMTASKLRLLFGKYGASERVHVWNHGAGF